MRHAASLAIWFLFALVSTHVLAAESATKEIDGNWVAVEIEQAGKKITPPPTPAAMGKAVILIEVGKYRAKLGDKVVFEADITTDATKSPKTYEMKGQPDRKGRPVINRGIYEIDEKGRLRMFFETGQDGKPPKSFDTKANKAAQLTVYERAK